MPTRKVAISEAHISLSSRHFDAAMLWMMQGNFTETQKSLKIYIFTWKVNL